MLLARLAEQLNALAARWDKERAVIRTHADIEVRNRFVRGKFLEMIHGLPARTQLNAKVLRVMELNGYRIENVLFESRPDFWVTGNLYVPASRGPFPGIISPCGHYQLARMQPDYQAVYLNLVKSGFVVLAYDPIGQGERRQYWAPGGAPAEITDPVYEHSLPGQVLLLMGQDLTHYRIWDGMRAIDYLLTRPEVDGSRIGCAGHSGGGTMTMFISALDDRGLISCASLARVDRYLHSAGVFVRDVLRSFDLPQVAAAVADRRLALLSPVGPMKEVDVPMAQRDYEFTRQVYVRAGAAERFVVSGTGSESSAVDEYLRLLG